MSRYGQPDPDLMTAVARIDRLTAERNALPWLSVRRWKAGRELRRVILATAASKGSARDGGGDG